MTDDERSQFGTTLEEYWPSTPMPIAVRVLDECERFGLPAVEQAMNDLRAAMPGFQKCVDADRILVICRRLTGELDDKPVPNPDIAKTAAYQASIHEQGRMASDELRQIDAEVAALPTEIQQRADAEIDRRYPQVSKLFSAGARSRLRKIVMKEIASAGAA
jgi:hypothetical protein